MATGTLLGFVGSACYSCWRLLRLPLVSSFFCRFNMLSVCRIMKCLRSEVFNLVIVGIGRHLSVRCELALTLLCIIIMLWSNLNSFEVFSDADAPNVHTSTDQTDCPITPQHLQNKVFFSFSCCASIFIYLI